MEEKNSIVTCVCPHCKQTIRINRPEKPGRYKYSCTACGKPFAISFKPEKTADEEETAQEKQEETHVSRKVEDRDRYRTIGGLVEKRSGLFKKGRVFPLAEGRQTIGRSSERLPSDIMFDDPCMSRRSVEVNVERHNDAAGQCFVYVMTVKRQKNPVTHNGESIGNGEEIVLHIGDTIQLGQTVLTLR